MKRYLINNLIRAIGIALFYTAVFLYAIIFNNPTGWLLFFFLLFLLLLDIFTLLPSLKKIKVQSIEKTIYRVDQSSNIQVELFRYRPTLLPIPTLMIFLSENSATNNHYLGLYSGQRKDLTFEWRPSQRGIFQELSFVLVSTDLFRLFSKQYVVKATGPFVVMPTLQIDVAEQLYHQLVSSMVNFTTPFGNQTFSIRSFRNYQVGDPFNLVDWKLSGKRNELIVKEYEHEAETETYFVFYGLAHEKFEELVSIYYSFIHFVEHKLSFQQTILADIPDAALKEFTMATVAPLSQECALPSYSNKKLVIFTPCKTPQLAEQLNHLEKTNELCLITFEEGALAFLWKDQISSLHKGGPIFEN